MIYTEGRDFSHVRWSIRSIEMTTTYQITEDLAYGMYIGHICLSFGRDTKRCPFISLSTLEETLSLHLAVYTGGNVVLHLAVYTGGNVVPSSSCLHWRKRCPFISLSTLEETLSLHLAVYTGGNVVPLSRCLHWRKRCPFI